MAHHQRLDQDVLDELEVVALQLLALGARSLRFLVGVEAEELRLVFELALLGHCGAHARTRTSEVDCNCNKMIEKGNDAQFWNHKVDLF